MLQQATDDVEEDILEVDWVPMEGALGKAKDSTGKGILFVGAAPRSSHELQKLPFLVQGTSKVSARHEHGKEVRRSGTRTRVPKTFCKA